MLRTIRLSCLIAALFSFTLLAAQNSDHPAYRIYTTGGQLVTFNQVVDKTTAADIVFFGEFHDNPIGHWLELDIANALYDHWKQNMMVGMEMFEADNQIQINEYFKGFLTTDNFERETRLWPNYHTDYKPILEFAREQHLKFIATNVPRRYASLVSREGLERLVALPDESHNYMANLPIAFDTAVACYRQILEMGGGDVHFAQAQAIKDATMAEFILLNLKKDQHCLHINGSFHSDHKEGIAWYIHKANPALRIANISMVQQKDISTLDKEYFGQADFIICVPENMTRTH